MTQTIVHGRPPQRAVNRLMDALLEFAWQKERERLLAEAGHKPENLHQAIHGSPAQKSIGVSLSQE
jgi:hypothetical protein